MSRIYAAGAAMGWTVAQTKTTSMWEFWSAWSGHVKANSAAQPGKMTEDEKDRIWDQMQTMDLPSEALTTQTYLWDGWAFLPQGVVLVG